jgi:hypothetical protein
MERLTLREITDIIFRLRTGGPSHNRRPHTHAHDNRLQHVELIVLHYASGSHARLADIIHKLVFGGLRIASIGFQRQAENGRQRIRF